MCLEIYHLDRDEEKKNNFCGKKFFASQIELVPISFYIVEGNT